MEDLEVGCWDIFEDNAYEAAVKAGVLEMPLLEQVKEPLSAIKPMKAVFDQNFVKRINGPNVKTGGSKMDYAEMVMDDIRQFKERTGVSRTDHDLVRVDRGVPRGRARCTPRLKDFECGLQKNDPEISPSQIYAYAALKSGVPYANGAPHLTTDMPALLELARNMNLPVCRQGLQERPDVHEDADRAGLEVAPAGPERLVFHQHPGQPRWRSAGRPGLLPLQGSHQVLGAGVHPAEASSIPTCTRTSTTRSGSSTIRRAATPRKAGTTSTFSGGWATRCRSRSISCAAIPFWPRRWCWISCCSWTWRSAPGMRGIQEWLSFYFKAPMHAPEVYPEHDIFIQLMKLKNTLRWMRGEDLITHLGLEYYD